MNKIRNVEMISHIEEHDGNLFFYIPKLTAELFMDRKDGWESFHLLVNQQ